MHMMTYDQHGQQHSSYDFAVRSISQGIELGLPPSKLTLGLPFYGRDSHGQWTTYEEILNKHYDLIGGRMEPMLILFVVLALIHLKR